MEFLDQAKDFFGNFFDNFFTIDSIALLVVALISFLLGMLINRLRLGRRLSKLRKENKTQENQITALTSQNKNLQEELEFKAADIQRAHLELTQSKDRIKILEAEKGQLHADLFGANEEIEKLTSTNNNYSASIEDLNDQILGLKTRNTQLLEEGGDTTGLGIMSDDGALNRLDALEEKLNRLEAENTDLKSRLTNYPDDGVAISSMDNETINRLLALDGKLTGLESENQLLKAELEKLKALNGPKGTYDSPLGDSADRGEVLGLLGDASDMEVTPTLQIDKAVLNDKLVEIEDDGTIKDDLTKVEGIGPFIENKLNKIGIYTYDDLAEMDDERIEEVTQSIGFFPGRIERDDWVGQAQKLMDEQTPESYGEADTAERISVEDDLKVVEGIGPKIEQVLKENGIFNWNTLADTNVKRLKEILSSAGSRYRLHDPSTWGDQAKLASEGEWEKLKTYQEYLKGGKDVS